MIAFKKFKGVLMRYLLILIVAILPFKTIFAHEFKTKDFCSAQTTDMCAHIGYDKKPTENAKFEFTFDIVNKKKAQLVKDVKIQAITKNKNGDNEAYTTNWKIRPDGHHWDAVTDQAVKGVVTSVKMTYKYENKIEEIEVFLN